jgi:hypothetical protein
MYFSHASTAPKGPKPPHCRGFTITLKHITLGRTPLDECSARRSDIYLTVHNTHTRKVDPPLRLSCIKRKYAVVSLDSLERFCVMKIFSGKERSRPHLSSVAFSWI